jgi:hypothetical protein
MHLYPTDANRDAVRDRATMSRDQGRYVRPQQSRKSSFPSLDRQVRHQTLRPYVAEYQTHTHSGPKVLLHASDDVSAIANAFTQLRMTRDVRKRTVRLWATVNNNPGEQRRRAFRNHLFTGLTETLMTHLGGRESISGAAGAPLHS